MILAILFYAILVSLTVYFIVYVPVRLMGKRGTSDIKLLSIIEAFLSSFICLSFAGWTGGNVSEVWIFSGALCIIYSYYMYQHDKAQAIQTRQLREKERQKNERIKQAQRREEAIFAKLKSRFPNLDIEQLKEKFPSSTIVFLCEEGKANDFSFSVSRVLFDTLKDASKVTGRSVIVELRVKNHQDINSSISTRSFYIVDEQLSRYYSNSSLSNSVSRGQKALETTSDIRPGMEGSHFLVFDVNPGVEAVFLTTKESMFGKDFLFSLAV